MCCMTDGDPCTVKQHRLDFFRAMAESWEKLKTLNVVSSFIFCPGYMRELLNNVNVNIVSLLANIDVDVYDICNLRVFFYAW